MSRKWLEHIHGGGLNTTWILDDGVLSEQELVDLFDGFPDDDMYREVSVGPIFGLQRGLSYTIVRVDRAGNAWCKGRYVSPYPVPEIAWTDEAHRRIFAELKCEPWEPQSLYTADSNGELVAK